MIERIKVNGTSFTLRTEANAIRATKLKGSAMFDAVDPEPIRGHGDGVPDVDSARKAIIKRLQVLSVRVEQPAPVLSRIDRIRELTAWVAELDRCEARAVELRGLIEGVTL